MTRELYIQCVIACLIGNILHIGFKIISLKKDHKIANLEFTVSKYLSEDKWALLMDVFASFVVVYLIDEFLEMDGVLIGKIKTIFVFVGFTGSYVLLQMMSVAKSNFRKAVDHKTNQSDKLDGTLDKPTPTK